MNLIHPFYTIILNSYILYELIKDINYMGGVVVRLSMLLYRGCYIDYKAVVVERLSRLVYRGCYVDYMALVVVRLSRLLYTGFYIDYVGGLV